MKFKNGYQHREMINIESPTTSENSIETTNLEKDKFFITKAEPGSSNSLVLIEKITDENEDNELSKSTLFKMSRDDIELKVNSDDMENSSSKANVGSMDAYLNLNHDPIGKKDIKMPNKSSENEIPLNTNVINSYNKDDFELSAINENELEKLGSMIETSLNGRQNQNLNSDNANISDKEINTLIENKLKSLNKIKSVNDNIKEIRFDLNKAEKKAYKDVIKDKECKDASTDAKSSEYTHSDKASNHVNMNENDNSLTSININKVDGEKSSNNDDQQRERSESCAADEAVEIKCEVECDTLLDDIKDEIIGDQDYTVPENFMDLANHFLTQEARVVLERIVVYKCPECPRVFTSAGKRSMHKAKHVSEQLISSRRNKESSEDRFFKGIQCPECDMRFVQESTLSAHMIMHQPFPNICHCGIGYYKLTDLEQHTSLVHNQTKPETKIPKSTWKPIINLKKTKRSEINRKRLKKELDMDEPIPEPTTSRYGRKQQRVVTLRERSPILEYDSDDLNDETLYEPKGKKRKFNVKTVEQVQAAAANQIAREQKRFEAKIIKKEKVVNKGPFICSICNRELKSYQNYIVHLQSHGNLRNYKCDICDKGFNTRTGLRNHSQTHLENQYTCSFCDKTFNCKHNMQTHERIHMNIKPFICGFCEKSFCDPSAKKRHERIHTGVKPYKCQHCPKAFSDASAAIVHRKRHENVRSYACRHCDKCYHTKTSRNLHEKLHVNGYDFVCDICQASFQLKIYLVTHMKNNHLATKVECSICGLKLKKISLSRHKLAMHGVKPKTKNTVFTDPVKIEIEIKKEV